MISYLLLDIVQDLDEAYRVWMTKQGRRLDSGHWALDTSYLPTVALWMLHTSNSYSNNFFSLFKHRVQLNHIKHNFFFIKMVYLKHINPLVCFLELMHEPGTILHFVSQPASLG